MLSMGDGGNRGDSHHSGDDSATCGDLLQRFAATYFHTYSCLSDMAAVIALAGRAVRGAEGHMYYLGESTCGLLGLIDVSEMVDTYGSRLVNIRKPTPTPVLPSRIGGCFCVFHTYL